MVLEQDHVYSLAPDQHCFPKRDPLVLFLPTPSYPFLLSSPLMEIVGCGEPEPTIRLFRKPLNEVQEASGDSRAANMWKQISGCLGSFAHLSLSSELLEADLDTQLGPLVPTQAQEK